MHTDLTVKGHRSASFFLNLCHGQKAGFLSGDVLCVIGSDYSLVSNTRHTIFEKKTVTSIKDQGVVKNKGGKDRE